MMSRRIKQALSGLLVIGMLVGLFPALAITESSAAAVSALSQGALEVKTSGAGGDFPLVSDSGVAAALWVSAQEEAPVTRVVNDLKEDVKRVTGQSAVICKDETVPTGPVVIIGTVGTDQVAEKLTEEEKTSLSGVWEKYLIKVVDANTLVIAGSDNRGVIFGVYELSERMGVSPWYYFADVPIQSKSAVYIPAGTSVSEAPDVQYRGIFINDEEKLSRWVTDVFNRENNASGVMNEKIYARIFELILRLKGNYIWAAMHVNSFNNIQANIDTLHEYGVVLGSSHCDMLLRTNVHEWENWCRVNGKNNAYDYTTNKEAVLQYWRENAERHKDTEAQWTVGMRGKHDEGFDVKNIMNDEYKYLIPEGQADTAENRKAAILSEIIEEQQKILKEVLGEETYKDAFMAFIPYKEVLPLYNNPCFHMSDDVTVIWPDDNHGMVRHVPTAEEYERAGGSGLYYHVSYWAPADQSYLWMSSLPLSVMGEELSKSWSTGIRKAWVLNVGDIKPAEGEMEYFIRCGWNVEQYTGSAKEFEADWMYRNFNSMSQDDCNEVADILTTFYQHTNVRKVDHMRLDVFEQTNYNEWDKRMAVYQDLYERTAAVAGRLSADQRQGFYELVQCKINWAYLTNKMFYYAEKSNLAYDQGRMASAENFSQMSIQAERERKAEIQAYSTMANGKWKGFIDPENHAPPVTTQLPGTNPALVIGDGALGAVIQGEALPTARAAELKFSPYGETAKFIDVFNKGAGSVSWSASADKDWVKLTDAKGNSLTSGTVTDETRLWVSIDSIDSHKGETVAVTITGQGFTKTVNVAVEDVTAPSTGYMEADGYVSMQAEHYTSKGDAGQKTWELLENAGRGFDGDMMRCTDPARKAVPESSIAIDSPWMEYKFTLTSSGAFPLEIYRLPTLNATNGGQVRFAYSVDGGAPVVVSSTAADEGTTGSQNPQWVKNLFRQIERHVVMLPNLSAGEHTLKIYMVDNLIALDKMVIYTAASSEADIPASALGPDESWCAGKNTMLGGPVETIFSAGKAVDKKDLLESWGTGAFMEKGGKVSLEAEYAMANVLDSTTQITDDMDAYTVSKKDVPLTSGANRGYNEWRFTQSDTGYGVRIADAGLAWSEKAEFENNAPELTYMVDFTTAGTYHVWIRVRMVDNNGDSLRFGLNHSMDGTNISTGQWWSYEKDEKWQWYDIKGTLKVTQQGVQPFHIWMREDGIYLDRIYLTTGSEKPSDDSWSPSVRSSGNPADAYKQAVAAKRTQIMSCSYPVGEDLGDYAQEAYDAMMAALRDAESLAASASYTEAKGEAALAKVDDMREALKNTQKLTDGTTVYYAYRDFENDQLGKYPFGVNDIKRDSGATVEIMEENGNQFLRLATTSDAKYANLSYPYSDKVTASADQRVVIEMKGRFHSGQFSSIALPYGSNGKQAMFVAFDNASNKHQLNIITNGDKKDSGAFVYDQWHDIKIVADMSAQTYMVYMDGTAANYSGTSTYHFRNSVSDLINHTFGIDNFANAQVDFDDIRVTVVDMTDVQTISGTVTITGTAQWGQELTADVSGITPAGASLVYVWKDSDGNQVGTGKTYTPAQADVDKTLTVAVSGTGAYTGSVTSDATEAVADADNTQGEALAEYVKTQRDKLDGLSIPVGSGLGCYGYAQYTALERALADAGALAEKVPSVEQVSAEKAKVEAAWSALDASLNLGGGSEVQYYAYRDFDGDTDGLFPYGFELEAPLSNATAAVVEANGNKFLRLTTDLSKAGKADMFLPYAETVAAESGKSVVIEYKVRNVNDDLQYINGAMVRNNPKSESSAHYALVTAVDNLGYQQHGNQLRAHDGSEGHYDGNANKRIVGTFTPAEWHEIKMIADCQNKTYMVYLDGELTGYNNGGTTVSTYNFRNVTSEVFYGQRFGIDNCRSGMVDFDDFKVYVAAPGDILSVEEVGNITAPLGSDLDTIINRLPEKVSVALGDGTSRELAVTWTCDGEFKPDSGAPQSFTGTLTVPTDLTNSKNLVAAATVTLTKLRIACVGDSVTYGSGGTNNVCGITDRNTQSYPAQLQKLLNNQYEVGNFGVSGACMADSGSDSNGAAKGYKAQSAYTDSLNFSPDMVIIMLGTNDSKALNWDNFKQDYVRDALELIDSYKSLKSNPAIYVATSPTVGEGSNSYGIQGNVVEEQIVYLQRQIALAAGTGFIDVHEATRNAGESLFPDKVHGSPEGYRLIAQTVADAIQEGTNPTASPIASAESATAATVVGFQPELPFVGVTYEDGGKGIAAVDWELTGVSFDAPGTVSVSGALTGIDGKTTYCVVNVADAQKAAAVRATATSQESANPQENAIDGNKTSTRWAASGAQLPQDLIIELDGTYTLEQIAITWYNSADGRRRYQYTVSVSEDGVNYTQVVDRSNNGKSGLVTDAMNGAKGKFVKITTTGKNGGSVSIWEVELFGTKPGGVANPVTGIKVLKDGEVINNGTIKLYTNANHADHSVKLTTQVEPENATDKTLNVTRQDGAQGRIELVRHGDGTATITAIPGEENVGEVAIEVASVTNPGVKAAFKVQVIRKLENPVSISIKDVNDPGVTPKFGQTLEADINQLKMTDAGKAALKYQWKRNGEAIDGAASKTYTLTAEDIGKVISVDVTADESTYYEGTQSAERSQAVAKADGPSIPGSTIYGVKTTTEANNDGKITGFGADYARYEYKAKDAQEWTEVPGTEVTGLANGEYQVRFKETATHEAGAAINVTVPAYDAVVYKVNIDSDMSNGTVTRSVGQAGQGTTITLTVKPDTGYALDTLTVTAASGEKVSVEGEGNAYTFTMPGEDVTVSAVFKKLRFTITHNLEHLTCSKNAGGDSHEVEFGTQEAITLVPDEGYELPEGADITIVNENGDAITSWTFNQSGTITITGGVTSNLTITAAGVPQICTVNFTVTNGVTAEDAPRSVGYGEAYSAVLNALSGYSLPQSITMTLDGEPFTEFDYDGATGAISIAAGQLTGKLLVITAAGVSNGSGDSGSSGGSSSGSSSTKVETIKNPDGSVVRVVTNLRTGTVTTTTTTADGVKIVVVAEKDGTVSETVTNPDGSRKKTVTNPDGSGSVELTESDGLKTTVNTTSDGEVNAQVTLPRNSGERLVFVPAKDVKPGTVAVIVHPDGTEEIVKDCISLDESVALVLKENASLRLVDNSKTFADVGEDYWGREAIEFVSSRELFYGTTVQEFSPQEGATRAMIFTVLARLSGVDTTGGENWYSAAMAWAMEAGVSDGQNPESLITREQLVTMLYRWYGQPAVKHGQIEEFQDAEQISSWAEDAMNWAVEEGIMQGKTNNSLDPQGSASRAEVAALLQRFITLKTIG